MPIVWSDSTEWLEALETLASDVAKSPNTGEIATAGDWNMDADKTWEDTDDILSARLAEFMDSNALELYSSGAATLHWRHQAAS